MGTAEEKKEKIVVSEDQAEDIRRALDFYYRFLSGQYEILAMDYTDLLDEKDRHGRKPSEIAVILKQIRARTIPELAGISLYGSYSAGCSDCDPHAGIAYDLCQEFWYRRAWFLHPEGGTTIDFNKPRHVDNDPCPVPSVSYSFAGDGKIRAEISACRTQFLVMIDALTSYFRLLSYRYLDLFLRISDDPEVVTLAGRLEDIYAEKRKKIPQSRQDLQEQFAKQFAKTADAIGKKLEEKI